MNDIWIIDIGLEVFKDEKNNGSVIQFYKNEAMSQFDFRNLIKEIRNELSKKK
jgi:hypothetical protein